MLLAINEFLQKHASAEFAVFGPLSTLRVPLPGTGLEECVGFLGARFIFCGRGGTICDRDKIQIGFANALVDVREDIGGLDPAFRLLEVRRFAIKTGEMVGIIAEVTIIDSDFSHGPIISAFNGEVLPSGRNGKQQKDEQRSHTGFRSA